MFPPRINRRFFRTFAQFLLLANASAQVTTSNEIGGRDRDAEHVQQRAEWFLHGRTIPGKSSAELRRRAYAAKMQARAARAHSFAPTASTGGWQPLGPVPLASDGSGDGFQNYNQVSGRATSVAIDPADPTGNTIYIGGAQAGVWKSTNAANANATNVTWIPLTDDQATLSIGAIAIQPGNTNAANSVIIAGTGEADNSADSYFGLGILRSADGGNTWNLTSTANTGSLSFSGLGATRITFSTANSNTVVAAMAATSEGVVDGALTSNTYRGLYTSTDGGQTWTYDALFSGGASEATSATSVVYNTAAGLFFAAIRYHGFYSSPDGLNWTVLANQPGAPGLLNATACPQNYVTTCPIYRAEITVVPGRNEMYVWFISLDSGGNPVDQGIWLSTNSGASWTQISDTGITNCGDSDGCGVQQGFYNLELLAVPNCPNGANTCTGDPTDLYAGAVNLYKCSLTSINPTCANTPFLNLTHVYGCNPLSALAHVHPDQHAAAFTILPSSSDLMYFANDGGIYRTLDGFTGLTTGSCTGTNLFDDLNQNLGSMTQFVSFSQSETDANTLLGGTQDNGSPATASATTNTSWGNVLSGDGGYNAIDPATGNWFASNPDTGSGTLGIQECSSGVNCNDSLFNVVVNSGDVGGDDGAFYFPYILDPQSATALVVGTCRVWTGPRTGGAFTDLSLNFDTLGVGTCTGDEVNVVRSVAAGGPSNSNGSQVIYATTDGLGPSASAPPVGGNVWVTTNPTAVSGVSSTFVNVTMNGPGGASINPNQFPISSAAIDTSDPTGNTAYVAIMGFTGGPGHIWQTVNAGANWSDFSGTGSNAIPDSPANAIAIDSNAHMIYVGTDVGVFQSSTSSPAWTEVGPIPSASATGFLPDVAITALALFDSGGQKLLRASTYGRGIWQFNLLATPNFAIAISNTPLTAFIGTNANFNGTLTAQDGYNNSVELSCTPGSSSPPSPCSPSPVSLVPTSTGAAFVVGVGTSTIADYDFNVQGAGSDSNNTTNLTAVTLHVVNLNLTPPSPGTVTAPDGTTSPPVSFQVVAEGTFTQSVTLSCSIAPPIPGATCNFTPGITVDPTPGSPVNATATVSLPSGTALKNYTVTLQATTEGAPQPFTTPFTLTVVANPDFLLSESTAFPNVKFGSNGTTGPIQIASQDGFNSQVTLSCAPTFGLDSCGLNPSLVTTFPATSTLTIYGSSFVVPGAYTLSVEGVSGSLSHYLNVPFNVGDFTFTGPSTLSASPGSQAVANLTLSSIFSYSGQINLTCNASSLPGAQCTIGGQNPIALAAGATAPVTVTINVPNGATANTYNITINAQDVGGEPTNSLSIPLSVTQVVSDNFQLATSQPFPTGDAGSQQTATVSVTSNYTGSVTASCNSGSLGGQCSVTSPHSVTPFPISPGAALTLTLTLNIPNSAAPNPSNSYSVVLTVTDSSGQPAQTLSLPLTVIQDFAVGTPSPSTQTIAVGQSITYNFSVLPIGAQFGDNVSFACTGAPEPACSFTPSSITPGNTAAAVVMTVNTTTSSSSARSKALALWLALPMLALAGMFQNRLTIRLLFLIALAALLVSCGGGTGNGGGGISGQGQGTQPGTYTITVTGTSGSLTHPSSPVTLIVNP